MATKILVVDDDRVTSSLLERLLTKAGYEVITASDGASGLELAETIKPALVISDMLLPKVHGIDLCKKIKDDRELRGIKVVLITAVYKGAATQADAKSWGADCYFEKPISTKDLLTWVEKNIPKEPDSDKARKARVKPESLDIDEIMNELQSLVADNKKQNK
jgi:DNA-binding response OmpR family regulator